jgi:hypothetical protein
MSSGAKTDAHPGRRPRFGQADGRAPLRPRELAGAAGRWPCARRAVPGGLDPDPGRALVTAGLFLAIFTLAIGPARGPVLGVEFTVFLAPGILMMTVIQNAFANTSSSIVISKVQGNIVDTLMPPLSAGELVAGFLAGAAARGLVVAVIITLALWPALGWCRRIRSGCWRSR